MLRSRGFWTGVASTLDLAGVLITQNRPSNLHQSQRYLREVGVGQKMSFLAIMTTLAVAVVLLVVTGSGYFILAPCALLMLGTASAFFAHRIPATDVTARGRN